MLNSYICHILQYGIQHWWFAQVFRHHSRIKLLGDSSFRPLSPITQI